MQAQIVEVETELRKLKTNITAPTKTVFTSTRDVRKKFVMAKDAESNQTYNVWTGEYADDGRMRYANAEFLTQGRGALREMTFFRRSGKTTRIYGIPNHTLIKEVERVLTED